MLDQVEEVKSKIDIVAIIGERVELKKAGSKYKAPCPFHAEKTPSFVVSPDLQIYKCFGCGKSGDVFTFLEEFEGMDFYESLKHLADKVGVKLKPRSGQAKGEKEKLIEVSHIVARFYNYILTKHEAGKMALDYLTAERGIKKETIQNFNLGYSPDVPLALGKFVVERQKVSIHELEKAGVVYMRSGAPIDRFRGRVIFPLLDHRGNTVGFAGRILPQIEKKLPEKIHVGKYVNSPETLIYKKSTMLYGLNETRSFIKKQKEVVVVEGELDMISLWQVGVKNVVAIKGSAFTDEQISLLSRFAKVIILALDSDFAGNEAARKAIMKADGEGMEVKVAILSPYKDPDELARKDPDELKKRISSSVSIWDFLINQTFAKYQGGGGTDKAKISKELVPILTSIDDKIVQAHYISLAAERLQVPVEAVVDQLKRGSFGAVKANYAKIETGKRTSRNRSDLLEERLLAAILLAAPAKFLDYHKRFKNPFAKRIVDAFLEFSKKNKFELSLFTESLPPELKERFSDLILGDIEGLENETEELLLKEVKLIEKELDIYEVKQKLSNLGIEIKTMEGEVDNNDLKVKEEEFNNLTKMLSRNDE